jgi:hypothetical protein
MNARVSEEFGQYFVRLPLSKAAHIVHGNALRLDWNAILPAAECSYVMGNPPFIGYTYQNQEQKKDLQNVLSTIKGAGVMDYVAAWYVKAAEYMVFDPDINAAFVSTNSITQGEQVGILWSDLFRRGVHIHFAHRTFQWASEAKGKAAVHCVIIGFGLQEKANKIIYEYENIKGEPHAIPAKNINPYLVDAPTILLEKRRVPICNVPQMSKGNQPTDGGNLLLNNAEKAELLTLEPQAQKWIYPFLGADEFINNIPRWCLWLKEISPAELRAMPQVMRRIENVKAMRLVSPKAATVKLANTPYLFGEIRQTDQPYLLIPSVSSENRQYIPIGYFDPHVIASNLVFMLPNATLYHFGILTSTMHNAWMRTVCGRLESRYRYSVGIVYNNFPWPEPADKQQKAIQTTAQGILDARAKFPDSTLADLYHPVTMPPELVAAHRKLDKAVDAAYGKKSFASEAERVAFLFECYQQLVNRPKPAKDTTSVKDSV